ncbi:hypothetical protein SDJN02_07438, partial [Cucurbita argyrosperma subsp. argyrosperma]
MASCGGDCGSIWISPAPNCSLRSHLNFIKFAASVAGPLAGSSSSVFAISLLDALKTRKRVMAAASFKWILQLHKDVPRAARFYSEGLDFTVHVCTLRWAELQSGPLKLALMQSNDHIVQQKGYSSLLSFTVTDINSTVTKLMAMGAELDGPIKLHPCDVLTVICWAFMNQHKSSELTFLNTSNIWRQQCAYATNSKFNVTEKVLRRNFTAKEYNLVSTRRPGLCNCMLPLLHRWILLISLPGYCKYCILKACRFKGIPGDIKSSNCPCCNLIMV